MNYLIHPADMESVIRPWALGTMLMLLLSLGGCASHKATESATPDSKCVDESQRLEGICIEEAASGLALHTLDQCDWLLKDREDFLVNCKNDLLSNPESRMIEDYSKYQNVHFSAFYQSIKAKCENTKLGEMTLSEVEYCSQRFIEFDNVSHIFQGVRQTDSFMAPPTESSQ